MHRTAILHAVRGQRVWRACGPGLALAGALLAATGTARAAASPDLTSLSLEQLLEVTVVGASKYEQKLSEVAAAVSVITRSELRAFGWRTIDQALTSLPGVYSTYDGQYLYLGTRGFSVPGDYNTRVLVTLNGNRLNDPVFDGGPFGRQLPIDLDLVERLEFIPGPGGAVYGQNAMFGVVNIVTRSGADLNGGELALVSQSLERGREARASWGRRLESGLDLLLSASAMQARGADRAMDFGAAGVSGVAVGMDGARDREVFARIAAQRWSFDLAYGSNRKDDPTGAYLSDPLVPGQFQGDSYTLAQLQYQDRFAGDALDLSARLFAGREQYRSRLRYGSWFSFPADGQWRGGELRLLWTGFAQHKLMLGLEVQDNTKQVQSVLDLTDPANDLQIAGSGFRSGLYVQDEWRWSDSLSATLGLRVDRQRDAGTSTSPRAALIWSPHERTTVKALYGRGHRRPNAYERDYGDGFAQVPNPALRGERIDTTELVLDHRVGRDLALRASLYRWTMHDLVTLGVEPDSGIPQYQSGPRLQARGLELSADRTWQGGARLRGSASVQDVADSAGQTLVNSPRLMLKLHASSPLPWAGLLAGFEWRFVGSRLTLDGSRLGGYALSNLHLSTTALAPGLELSLGVSNLFGKAHAHPGADSNWQNALAGDGRSVQAGLTYRF